MANKNENDTKVKSKLKLSNSDAKDESQQLVKVDLENGSEIEKIRKQIKLEDEKHLGRIESLLAKQNQAIEKIKNRTSDDERANELISKEKERNIKMMSALNGEYDEKIRVLNDTIDTLEKGVTKHKKISADDHNVKTTTKINNDSIDTLEKEVTKPKQTSSDDHNGEIKTWIDFEWHFVIFIFAIFSLSLLGIIICISIGASMINDISIWFNLIAMTIMAAIGFVFSTFLALFVAFIIIPWSFFALIAGEDFWPFIILMIIIVIRIIITLIESRFMSEPTSKGIFLYFLETTFITITIILSMYMLIGFTEIALIVDDSDLVLVNDYIIAISILTIPFAFTIPIIFRIMDFEIFSFFFD